MHGLQVSLVHNFVMQDYISIHTRYLFESKKTLDIKHTIVVSNSCNAPTVRV